MLTLDFYDIQRSNYYLEKYRQYKGEVFYTKRRGVWYLTLAGWLVRIGPFEFERDAKRWAKRYLRIRERRV